MSNKSEATHPFFCQQKGIELIGLKEVTRNYIDTVDKNHPKEKGEDKIS